MRRPGTVDLMLTTVVVLWALNFTVTKYALTHGFHPLAYASIRYAAGAVLFTGFTYRREGSLTVGRRDVVLLLGAAVVGIWLNQVSYTYALTFTTAATVGLILGITPIVAALISFAVGLERLSPRFWAASAVSFAGVGLVAIGSGNGVSGDIKGDLLAVATAATWAAYSVAVAPLMRRYSPYKISAFVLVAGSIPLIATGITQLAEQRLSLGVLPWLGLVYGIVGPLFTTNILWFMSIDRVGPSRATLFTNLQPFLAAIFALLLLSERMTTLQVAGGVAILCGIVVSRGRASAVPSSE